jgi:hypothetical protein
MSTFEGRARSAWAARPPEAALEREGAIFQRASELARGLAAARREIAANKREIKRLLADLAAAKATSGGKEAGPMADASDAVAAGAVEKLKRIQEQKRSRRRRRRERLRATTGAAVDADTLMESAGCEDEAEQAAAPLVELDQAAAAGSHGDVSPAMVAGAGDVGFVSMAPVEVEVLEEDEVEFKKGEVVVLCVERETWKGGLFVEPGAVGTVLGPAKGKKWDVLVEFPHSKLYCYHYQLRLHTENEQKAITDGLPPKRLWSAIDHTGESPGPPESKKVQAKQDHGQADGGHEAKSQDYGTRFVNGNKGVG